jgi:oleate hydratase
MKRFGFQPWHSAIELKRALREYLSEFHSLAILSCLDITGYYQHESIYLPIYFYLRSLDVDFRFDIKVRGIETTPDSGNHTISRLDLIQHGFEIRQDIGPYDIVIATLGSTVSGCATGTHEHPPVLQSIEPAEQLDENWSLWLELRSRHSKFGNPYNFCTRQSELILESFTITTEDPAFFKHLSSLSRFSPASGTFIILRESRWKLNLCLPTQPVF